MEQTNADASSNTNTNTMMKVVSPTVNEKSGKKYWVRLGSAYRNRDGSTNVYLDALPTNRQLQIRDLSEWDLQRMKKGSGKNNSSDGLPF